jgi:hypothetical protein
VHVHVPIEFGVDGSVSTQEQDVSDFLDQPVETVFDDLQQALRKRGTLNARALTIQHTECEPCSLVFLGFNGIKSADGHCKGVYQFRLAQPHSDAERDVYDHSRLPGWQTVTVRAMLAM